MPAGTNRYAPPASIRGPSLKDVYAQQKADREFEALLESDKPRAQVKAFAQGMAMSAWMPMALMAYPAMQRANAEYMDVVQRAQLAHWLKGQGAPEDKAHQVAAGVQKYLRMGSVPEASEKAVRSFTQSGYVIPYEGMPKRPMPKEELRRALVEAGNSPQLVDETMAKAVKVTGGGDAPFSKLLPSRTQATRVLDAARESFKDSGIRVPGYAAALKKHFRPVLATAGILGVLGGTANVLRTRKKRKELQELRRRAGARR